MSPPPVPDPAINALVVEDDPTVRAMLGAWLHTEGCRRTLTEHVAGARQALAADSFDILLCDIHLPDADGTDLVSSLPPTHQGLPVIFLTGSPTLDSAVRSVSLRVAAYLLKPPDPDELRRIMHREVAVYRSRRAIRSSRSRLADWDRDLQALEASASPGLDQPFIDYVQITIRHLTRHLADLEHSLAMVKADASSQPALNHSELLQSLRTTISVIERTRHQFKSRELGDLRRDLQAVLGRVDQISDGRDS